MPMPSIATLSNVSYKRNSRFSIFYVPSRRLWSVLPLFFHPRCYETKYIKSGKTFALQRNTENNFLDLTYSPGEIPQLVDDIEQPNRELRLLSDQEKFKTHVSDHTIEEF